MSRATDIRALCEEIYGKLATGFHRTSKEGLAGLISGRIFTPGGGDLYGKGAYLTQELSSQRSSNMIHAYGPYIIKFKVNLNGMLIFDKHIAETVYGPHNSTVQNQLVNVFRLDSGMIARMGLHELDNTKLNTADNAVVAVRRAKSWLEKHTKGLLFTGRNDGRVIVAYDTRSLIPMAYAHSSGMGLMFGRELKWQKVNNLRQIIHAREQEVSGYQYGTKQTTY
jgi:hypothetical protein